MRIFNRAIAIPHTHKRYVQIDSEYDYDSSSQQNRTPPAMPTHPLEIRDIVLFMERSSSVHSRL